MCWGEMWLACMAEGMVFEVGERRSSMVELQGSGEAVESHRDVFLGTVLRPHSVQVAL